MWNSLGHFLTRITSLCKFAKSHCTCSVLNLRAPHRVMRRAPHATREAIGKREGKNQRPSIDSSRGGSATLGFGGWCNAHGRRATDVFVPLWFAVVTAWVCESRTQVSAEAKLSVTCNRSSASEVANRGLLAPPSRGGPLGDAAGSLYMLGRVSQAPSDQRSNSSISPQGRVPRGGGPPSPWRLNRSHSAGAGRVRTHGGFVHTRTSTPRPGILHARIGGACARCCATKHCTHCSSHHSCARVAQD